jgi:nitrite reductase/ring-hydroxylating ferredoxin subunit
MLNTPKPTAWIRIATLESLPVDRAQGITINNQSLVLIRCEGDKAQVLQGICSHMWYPLANSPVEGCVLTCALHQSSFDVPTGAVENWAQFPPPIGAALEQIKKSKALRIYPTKVENGEVYVEWATSDPDSVRVRM